MSWWDTSQLTNFASTALKSAQKKIDKVLDIQETGGTSVPRSSSRGSLSSSRQNSETPDFFSGWIDSSESAKKSFSSRKTTKSTSEPTGSSDLQQSKGRSKTESVSDDIPEPASEESLQLVAETPQHSCLEDRPEKVADETVTRESVPKFSVGDEDEKSVTAQAKLSSADVSVEERLSSSGTDEKLNNALEETAEKHDSVREKAHLADSIKKTVTPKSLPEKGKVKKKSAPLKLGSKIVKKKTVSKDTDVTIEKNDSKIVGQDENVQFSSNDSETASALQSTASVTETTAHTPADQTSAVPSSLYDFTDGNSMIEEESLSSVTEQQEPKLPSEGTAEEKSIRYDTSQVQEKEESAVCEAFEPASTRPPEEHTSEIIIDETQQEDLPPLPDTSQTKTSEKDLETVSTDEDSVKTKDVSCIEEITVTAEADTSGVDKTMSELAMITDENVDESGWMLESEIDLDSSVSNVKLESGEQSCDDSTHTLVPNESSSSVEEMMNKSEGDLEIVEKQSENEEREDTEEKGKIEEKGEFESGSVEDSDKIIPEMETLPESEDTNTESSIAEASHEAPGDMVMSTMSTASSTSSFVKCMIEEAMTESQKHDDADSHSSVSTDHSDMVRIRSGVNSGHTSGDDIDTNTSSDIEIISTPTPNGDYRVDRAIDLSPLRHAFSRTMRKGSPPGHTRSDSGSSGQSRPDECDMSSPERHEDDHRKLETNSENYRKLRSLAEEGVQTEQSFEDTDNPLQTERLLKNGKLTPVQELDTVSGSVEQQQLTLQQEIPEYKGSISNLEKKLAEMAEIIDVREKKLVELSVTNADLTETNSILRCQLEQEEKNREQEMLDVNKVTEEFTVRIADQEMRLQSANKERDVMKKHLQAVEVDFSKKLDEMEMVLAEKEEQIAELLAEGEKLSKQQLQANNIVKKLRSKEKETDTLLKSQKQTVDEQKAEILRLHNVLDSKEEVEKKQSEAITQLNGAVKKQDREISRLASELEDAQEKTRSMQVALDNSYKELGELHKSNVSRQSKATEEALSAELQAREELRLSMERQSLQYKQEQESLILQIEDLQISLSRMEKEHGRREDVYRQEISDLHQRLQEAEERNENLSQSVSSATRPLLRQIENLQSTYAAQSLSWEKVEKTMTDRLSEVQEKLTLVTERERTLNEKCLELTSKNTSLETQVSTLRQERARLTGHLDIEKTKLEVLEDSKNNDLAQADRLKNSLLQQIEELKKDKLLLENSVEMEKMAVEAEKKKLILAHETIKEKERQLRDRIIAPPGGSLTSSIHGSLSSEPTTPIPQDESIEKAMMATSMINSMKSSVYESLRNTGAATMVENLQAQLKQRDGEITQLVEEISQLEKTREALSKELVDLTTQNDKLEKEVMEYPEFQQKYKELDNRYQALLQMYGEKVEQMEELQLDLQDIRELYKTQIDQLLKNA